MKSVVSDYNALFSDVPKTTHFVEHDVDVGNATPLKQHPYRVNPVNLEAFRTEKNTCWKITLYNIVLLTGVHHVCQFP
jgi:hypothetical protein